MTAQPSAKFVDCPRCGADYLAGEAASCWVCGEAIPTPSPNGQRKFRYRAIPTPAATAAELERLAAAIVPTPPVQFPLSALFGVVTFIAVDCALLVQLPWLGLILAGLGLLAGFRAWAIVEMQRELRRERTPFVAFAKSCGLVGILFGVALLFGAITYAFGYFMLSRLSEPILIMTTLVGSGISAFLPLATFMHLWPRHSGTAGADDMPWL